jgi:hypothetical protein
MRVVSTPGDGAVSTPSDAVASTPDAPAAGPPILTVTMSGQMTSSCDTSTQTQTITFHNIGGQELVVNDGVFTDGFGIASGGFPVRIPANGSSTIAVAPPSITIGTHRGGDQITGTLTVTTNEAKNPAPINLVSNVIGANIEIAAINPVDPADATNMLFSSFSGRCPSPGTVMLKLTGASSLTLDPQSSASGFVYSGFTSGVLTSASTQTMTISLASGANCTLGASVSFSASSGNVCQAPTMTVSFAPGSAGCSCF